MIAVRNDNAGDGDEYTILGVETDELLTIPSVDSAGWLFNNVHAILEDQGYYEMDNSPFGPGIFYNILIFYIILYIYILYYFKKTHILFYFMSFKNNNKKKQLCYK